MTSNQIEEVKNKTDIVSLISEYIEVKKAGRNYKANCPFHGEKTPSFMITPELQMYKCFGCGRHGDCFTFIEEHEGMEFSEALKYLAEKAGVKLVLVKNEGTSEREKIIEINKSVLNFYNYALHDHPQGKKILEYLKNDRGLNDESINFFKLGYSPENYDALNKYLTTKKKFKLQDLLKSGNLVGRGIDRFRGRVIFPLFDHRENCIGFAGRILPWQNQDTAKYINSPDTEAYHKSKVLYGLNVTKSEIRNKGFAVIVEGELDMISSYQSGIRNAIAIKGSALTEDQLRLIGRFAQKIVLCLDSDFAGNEAVKKGAILAINMNFEVKVALLHEFKDPDDAARKDPEGYLKAIEESVDIWEFLINSVFEKYPIGTGDGKSGISKEVVPLLRLIQDRIVQSYYIEMVARKLSVTTDAVLFEVQKVESSGYQKTVNDYNDKQSLPLRGKNRRQLLEEKLLVNYIGRNKKMLFEDDVKSLFSSDYIIKIINFMKDNDFPLPKELEEGYAEMVLENSDEDDIDVVKKELISLDTKQKLETLGEKIKLDESNEELLKEFSILSKKLSTL
jgi:DNA primase